MISEFDREMTIEPRKFRKPRNKGSRSKTSDNLKLKSMAGDE